MKLLISFPNGAKTMATILNEVAIVIYIAGDTGN